MATFDDLFGKKGKFIKWNAEGETLIFQLLGEPDGSYPQRDFKTGERKYLIETEEPNLNKPDASKPSGYKNKWKPVTESQFDAEVQAEKELGIMPLTSIMIPVRVVARKRPDGTADANFESFEAKWELTDEQKKALELAMMEDRSLQVGHGTICGVKCIDYNAKPRKYAIKLKAGE